MWRPQRVPGSSIAQWEGRTRWVCVTPVRRSHTAAHRSFYIYATEKMAKRHKTLADSTKPHEVRTMATLRAGIWPRSSAASLNDDASASPYEPDNECSLAMYPRMGRLFPPRGTSAALDSDLTARPPAATKAGLGLSRAKTPRRRVFGTDGGGTVERAKIFFNHRCTPIHTDGTAAAAAPLGRTSFLLTGSTGSRSSREMLHHEHKTRRLFPDFSFLNISDSLCSQCHRERHFPSQSNSAWHTN